MQNNKKVVPVFFSSDENYLPFMAVALKSIKENTSKDTHYKVYVLCEDIPVDKKDKLDFLIDDTMTIDFIDVGFKVNPIRKEMHDTLRDYYTLSIFYRLFIPTLFPEYDKAIYIDSDIVVLDDLTSLFDIDIKDTLLGVVVDQVVSNAEPFKYYTKKHIGVDANHYFNSGVLLMNLSALRNFRLEEKFVSIIKTHVLETVAPDQDYLNYLCKDKVTYLHAGWDKMSITDKDMPISDVKLIHYNMFNKPWRYDDVPYETYFWKYANATPFGGYLNDIKQNYPEDKKILDAKSGEVLLANAMRIADSGNTFVNVLGESYEK
ncbi:MAG: glycosyltransferase family 8 protein [Clostridia bacterium]|nr:glycosyltransferase family 8 protein [Clostridia bacterium]